MEIRMGRFFSVALLGCLLLWLIPSTTFALNGASAAAHLVPEFWVPSLEQVAETLDESSKGDTQASQQALNRVSQNLADVRDAQLFITYIHLMQALDARGQAQLFEEQKRWLGKRDELARAAVVSKGGTLAPLEYSGAFRKITEERLAELQKRLQQGTSTIQKQ